MVCSYVDSKAFEVMLITVALSKLAGQVVYRWFDNLYELWGLRIHHQYTQIITRRSEERRVGKECRP